MFNKESGYGQTVANKFVPVAPTGRSFFVGNATLDNIAFAQQIFKHDPLGTIRMYTTLASAVAGAFQYTSIAVTASTSADTLTVTSGVAHNLNNGEKVVISGTTAPTGLTLGAIYYVVGVVATAPSVFQVAANRGGTAIDLTGTGTAVTVLPLQTTGDTIYVMPGHAENVSTSTALNINVAGIAIRGLGEDETRPTFTLDTGIGATVTISMPAVSIENIIWDFTGFDAISTGFTISATDVRIEGCKFITGNATNQAVLGITTSAKCDRFKFINNYVYGTTDAGTTNFLQMVGGNDIVIKGNYMIGAYTTSLGPINNATTAGLRWLISGNTLINQTASSTKCIVLVSTTTGMVSDNRFGFLSGTAPITSAGAWWAANYGVNAAGTLSVLI